MKKTGTSLCFSPFLTDRISSLKSQERGINNDFDNSKLTCTILVQSNSRPVHNRASSPASIFNNLVLNMTLKLIAKKILAKTWLRKEFHTRPLILSQISEDQAIQLFKTNMNIPPSIPI